MLVGPTSSEPFFFNSQDNWIIEHWQKVAGSQNNDIIDMGSNPNTSAENQAQIKVAWADGVRAECLYTGLFLHSLLGFHTQKFHKTLACCPLYEYSKGFKRKFLFFMNSRRDSLQHNLGPPPYWPLHTSWIFHNYIYSCILKVINLTEDTSLTLMKSQIRVLSKKNF